MSAVHSVCLPITTGQLPVAYDMAKLYLEAHGHGKRLAGPTYLWLGLPTTVTVRVGGSSDRVAYSGYIEAPKASTTLRRRVPDRPVQQAHGSTTLMAGDAASSIANLHCYEPFVRREPGTTVEAVQSKGVTVL